MTVVAVELFTFSLDGNNRTQAFDSRLRKAMLELCVNVAFQIRSCEHLQTELKLKLLKVFPF